MLTQLESFDDQGEVNEREEHHDELVKAGEDTPKALEAAEQSLDFVAPLVHLAVILPWGEAVGLWWHHWDETQIQCKLPRLVPFVGAVHHKMNRPIGRAQVVQELTPRGRVVRLTRREREGDGGSSIRGNHMNLGGPSAARFADGLGSVFFSAPVPSG